MDKQFKPGELVNNIQNQDLPQLAAVGNVMPQALNLGPERKAEAKKKLREWAERRSEIKST